MGVAVRDELGFSQDGLPQVLGDDVESKSVARIGYTTEVADRILDYYAEGKSFHQIAKMAEMPSYPTLLKWARRHPEFAKRFEAIRTVRALHHEHEAIRAAEEASGKDADRLKFEAHKWGAEVNDPGIYGKKVTHGGDSDRPIVLQVVTGFPEPNAWQRPPKLNEDGTIQKEVPSGESDRPAGAGDGSRGEVVIEAEGRALPTPVCGEGSGGPEVTGAEENPV